MVAEIGLILKHELRYFRALLGVALAILLVFATIYTITGTYRALLEIGTTIQVITLISIAVTQSMDKRDRMLRILPVGRLSIALTHAMPIWLTSSVLLIAWIGFGAIGSETPPLEYNLAFIADLFARFLINTLILLSMTLGFELADRLPLLGIPLVTILGAAFGFSIVTILKGGSMVLGSSLAALTGLTEGTFFLVLLGTVLLLYAIDVAYAYRKPLSKYSMK